MPPKVGNPFRWLKCLADRKNRCCAAQWIAAGARGVDVARADREALDIRTDANRPVILVVSAECAVLDPERSRQRQRRRRDWKRSVDSDIGIADIADIGLFRRIGKKNADRARSDTVAAVGQRGFFN